MFSILIVDDEGIERRGIKYLLKRMNVDLKIYESTNGKEALEFLKENTVDILFTDIKMPFMDGIELIKEAKKLNIKSKIIIFSGYEEFEYAKFATKMGVVNYILKPVDPDEFNETINKVIMDIAEENKEEKVKNKNIDFIREHIVYSLLNGFSVDDLKKKTENLIDFKFLNDYKRMFLLEFNYEFFGEKDNDIKEFLNDIIDVPFQYLNLNLNESLIIFNQITGDFEFIKEMAANIYESILNKYGDKCYIAISSEIEGPKTLSKKYMDMELLLEKKFYDTDRHVIFNEENKIIAEGVNDEEIIKQIKHDIKIKDEKNFKADFEVLCKRYKNESGFSQIYVKFIFSDLLKDFYKNLEDVNENDFKKDIDRLYKAKDFNAVVEILNNYKDKLNNEFSKNINKAHGEIGAVKKYISKNFAKDLSIDILASKVCLAPSYLSYIFKKETGQNITKYIKECRMNKAKDLLENSYEKIVNISNEVGYRNVSYFCQSFHEYFGVSPQKYRNEGEGKNEDL